MQGESDKHSSWEWGRLQEIFIDKDIFNLGLQG